MANIVRALQGVCSFGEIRDAFTSRHARVKSEVQIATKGWGSVIEVNGTFVDRDTLSPIGHFKRRLEMPGDRINVQHSYVKIDEPYRRCGIVWEHYSRALRFYHETIRPHMVYMDAVEQGPYVWGDLGFEFTSRIWRQLISRAENIHQIVYGFPLRNYPSTATGLAHLEGVDGFPVGEEAIRAVHSALGPLRMFLMFDAATVQFLEQEGILAS